jgi:hypothetical protein
MNLEDIDLKTKEFIFINNQNIISRGYLKSGLIFFLNI